MSMWWYVRAALIFTCTYLALAYAWDFYRGRFKK